MNQDCRKSYSEIFDLPPKRSKKIKNYFLGSTTTDSGSGLKNVQTITLDNGPEFADHLTIKSRLNANVYFTNPYRSWEKGAIENANKLIRQFIPKKTNLRGCT